MPRWDEGLHDSQHFQSMVLEYALGLLKKRQEKCQITIFNFARCVRKLRYYSDVIHSFDWKSAVEHDDGV